ncbi:unnamed protein product [Paramecium sonneborni]|uniref:Uncharacterized protein n=1 Tax=Paramecium sonneborni TaxID=65129 RepID=A0A8S1RMX6_9CILI|nr:unnamed protein product [Paramecium sonneborni]
MDNEVIIVDEVESSWIPNLWLFQKAKFRVIINEKGNVIYQSLQYLYKKIIPSMTQEILNKQNIQDGMDNVLIKQIPINYLSMFLSLKYFTCLIKQQNQKIIFSLIGILYCLFESPKSVSRASKFKIRVLVQSQ